MARLSKAQAKLHLEAQKLLEQETLSDDERWRVFETWQESAHHVNNLAGAFFTPMGLARDFAIEVPGRTIIDLCAGIGALSFAVLNHRYMAPPKITCVELNPHYAAVGQKLVPEATWIVASVFDLPKLGRFDCAIANPPFGRLPKETSSAPRYKGKDFEYCVIDIASDLADYGVFIIPQMSAPFRYSGVPAGGWPSTRVNGVGSTYEDLTNDKYQGFSVATGITLESGCGIDTSIYSADWHGVSPQTEVVVADFIEARVARAPAQSGLMLEAA